MALNGAGDDSGPLDMRTLDARRVRHRLFASHSRHAGNTLQLLRQIFDALHKRADNGEVMPAMFADDRILFNLFSAKWAFHEESSLAPVALPAARHENSAAVADDAVRRRNWKAE